MSQRAWAGFVARRWFRPGRRLGPSLAPAAAGIAVGVAALLCVIGVMNGFQMGFIEAVLELDSYHLRIPTPAGGGLAGAEAVADRAREGLARTGRSASSAVAVALPFADIRTMLSSPRGKSAPVRLKLVPDDALLLDAGLASRLELRSGDFRGGLAIGSEMARRLGLRVGDAVSVLDVSADEEEGLAVAMVELPVAAVFHSGYYDFDASLAFLPASASAGLGDAEPWTVGLKLGDRYADARAMAELEALGIVGAESWRDYNRAFFGALRMEKTVMMLLVGLIFIVVGVNIFHSMRKAVYGRTDDIATLKALGADSSGVRRVFMLDGLAAGGGGALLGLAVGLLLALNVNEAFDLVESAAGFIYQAFGGSGRAIEFFSPEYFYIADVPVRLGVGETIFISVSGAASAVVAALGASSRVSRIMPSEVLRDE